MNTTIMKTAEDAKDAEAYFSPWRRSWATTCPEFAEAD